jgi:hypothetical protein
MPRSSDRRNQMSDYLFGLGSGHLPRKTFFMKTMKTIMAVLVLVLSVAALSQNAPLTQQRLCAEQARQIGSNKGAYMASAVPAVSR